MIIHEMTEDECRTALERVSFGRLACARDDQPYVVPIYFSYDGEHSTAASTGSARSDKRSSGCAPIRSFVWRLMNGRVTING